MVSSSPLADEYIEANAKFRHDPGSNGPVTRLVIHATVSPCEKGGAKATARYFQSPGAGGAAHYVVDPYEIVACGTEDEKMSHAPPNAGSIGVELCDPQTGDPNRWDDQAHTLMLAKAAHLAADICARHNLPIQWLSPQQLLAGDAGITSHANVSAAWHETDHTDPGSAFPVAMFIAAVAGHIDPAPAPHQEDDMPPAPATAQLADGNVVSVVRGSDHATFFYTNAVGAFSPLPGAWASGPSIVATKTQLIVRGVGTDGALYETRLSLTDKTPKWSAPQPLGGKAG